MELVQRFVLVCTPCITIARQAYFIDVTCNELKYVAIAVRDTYHEYMFICIVAGPSWRPGFDASFVLLPSVSFQS
jgi:hypothetical protein